MARIAGEAETEGAVHPVPLGDALSERYLAYALSTITARSLPDVRTTGSSRSSAACSTPCGR